MTNQKKGRLLGVFLVAVGAVFLLGRLSPDGSSDRLVWAQQTGCGNGIIEPGEQCDPPGSISCPPGSPAGAFQACNQDCTCPTQPPDHYQCYEVKPGFFPLTNVTVQDQ